MVKVGRCRPSEHKLCLPGGVHWAVEDALHGDADSSRPRCLSSPTDDQARAAREMNVHTCNTMVCDSDTVNTVSCTYNFVRDSVFNAIYSYDG